MHLIAQSAALLEATPGRWRALVAAADPRLLAREPMPAEWSALGCLQHLLDTEEHVFPVRLKAFLAGRDFPAFDPDADGTLLGDTADGLGIVERFAERRTENLALLRALHETDLDRTARHPELGPVTLEELLNHWVGHDLMHTVQGERALMQPFIPATGPWRSYFTDHDALLHG